MTQPKASRPIKADANADHSPLHRQLASLQAEDGEQSPPMSKKRRLAVEDESGASSSSPSTPSPLEVSHPTQSSKGPPLPPEEAAEQARDNAAQQEPDEPSATAERKDSAAANLAAASVPPVSAVAAGIAVDPTEDLAPTQPQRERPAVVEERTGLIQFRVVTNRNLTKTAPADLVILTGLKNIFQRQLPKMPREYITRLVLDRNHVSMAIVKRGLQVVGGITYRPFNKRRFAEIVFCAIDSSQQVKGYGQHLMNHLKDYVKESSDVMHFLTYADNYAIGYFKKQGFTKEISLPRSVWVGYIKDYEGGTLMQCSMVPRVQYLSVHEMLAAQKEMVLSRIRAISQSHIVHPGLAVFRDKDASADPETGFKVAPADVPGLASAGWTPEMDVMARRPKRGPHHSLMRSILVELQNHAASWPFMAPVNGDEVPDYYSVIQSPMDLATMESKLLNNQYDEGGVDAMIADSQLIFDNCRAYNPRNSPYAKCADKLEKFLKENLPMVSPLRRVSREEVIRTDGRLLAFNSGNSLLVWSYSYTVGIAAKRRVPVPVFVHFPACNLYTS